MSKEGKRRADVVGLFSNESSIIRLTVAVLLAANGDGQARNPSRQTEPMADLMAPAPSRKPRPFPTMSAYAITARPAFPSSHSKNADEEPSEDRGSLRRGTPPELPKTHAEIRL
ncbi:transposase (plasmid) [Aureimonas sp. AU20]|nr:transposase [Aureimonas sp. AU20]